MRKATPELAPDARNQQSNSTRPDRRPDSYQPGKPARTRTLKGPRSPAGSPRGNFQHRSGFTR